MPTYHFIAKVPLTAYTIIEAETEEEATLVANSEDRELTMQFDDETAKYLMQTRWVIREIDEGPQDIELDPHKPTTL
ncbi:MAG: hypothetical protein US20_C0026G0012 [Candidatus Pacebacteria bacterium GW2011_GWF1_36_5]|nr:MAG: hypothetical protein US20_C0026G0012 [Candidatus Pacebacteria bacterium GW2011_GWF1_36_5]